MHSGDILTANQILALLNVALIARGPPLWKTRWCERIKNHSESFIFASTADHKAFNPILLGIPQIHIYPFSSKSLKPFVRKSGTTKKTVFYLLPWLDYFFLGSRDHETCYKELKKMIPAQK